MYNKKGQTSNLAFSLIVAFMIFMIGMVTINMLTPSIDATRIDLNCATPSAITDGTKVMCLFTDITVPYFFVLVFAMAGGFATKNLLV